MRLKVSNVCQLLDKSKYPATQTINGITWTNNGDGTITANGTATARSVLMLKTGLRVTAGKYCVLGKVGTVAFGIDVFVDDVYSSSPFADSIFTIDKESALSVYPVVENGDSANSVQIKPQILNLTEMYGAGNEPTTVEQFRADYPNELYDYNLYNYLTLNRGKYIANKEPVQLLDKSKLKAVTSKNVTATPDITNGMWTISGAATASEYLQIEVYYPGTDFNIGDKLFLRHSNIDNSVYFPYAAWYDKDNKYLGEYDGMGVFSVTNPKTAYIACYFTTRTVGDINVTTQVQLFNLTRMYGKGNEPTGAEFVAQYPGFDYSVNKYNAITFR